MQRDNFTQLPSGNELSTIMEKEAFRAVPASKQNIHYPDFSPVVNLFEYFGLPADVFTQKFDFEQVKQVLDLPVSLIQQLTEKLMNESPSDEAIVLLNAAYDYLAEEDDLAHTDYVFVYGAKTLARIEKAIEIYKLGYASKMIISGGNPIYDQENELSEAERYRKIAIEKGVPEEAIILEAKSITIPDNVRTSLNMLDEQGLPYKSFILVNSPYVQRRGWALFKKYCEDDVQLIRVNCSTLEKFARDRWYKNEDGIKIIINEFVKMKVAVTLNTA